MESRDEACELQQLVSSDVEGDGDDIAQDSYTVSRDEKIVSPVRSNKVTIFANKNISALSQSFNEYSIDFFEWRHQPKFNFKISRSRIFRAWYITTNGHHLFVLTILF